MNIKKGSYDIQKLKDRLNNMGLDDYTIDYEAECLFLQIKGKKRKTIKFCEIFDFSYTIKNNSILIIE